MPIFHGIKVVEPTSAARLISTASTAVIGLLATASDADADLFPLNKPALITDTRSALGKAGEEGTLAKALEAIDDQTNPVAVVVRVEEGEDEEETDANVIGGVTGGQFTGMQALLAAEVQTGVRPRILGAPGLDSADVAAELAITAQKLRGFAYARAIGEDIAAASVYRATFSARELMLIWPEFTGGFAGDAVARALGLRAKIDEQTGWHKTLSNVPIAGVSGITADVDFDLQSNATGAGTLNDAQITTIVNMNGHRFWGNRTTSDDDIWAFESRVRTSQALMDTMAEGLAWAVDKPLGPQLLRDITETIAAKLRQLKAEGRIIDAEVLPLDPAVNTPAFLASGQLALDYEFTDVAPLEGLTLNQRVTDRFYARFGEQLASI